MGGCVVSSSIVHLLAVVMLLLSCGVLGSHFRGGTISWTSEGGNKVHFNYRMGWKYARGPGCTKEKIGSYVTGFSSDYWRCVEGGCPKEQHLHDVNYFCTGASPEESWEQGQNEFTHSFQTAGPFVVSYSSGNWIRLSNGKGDGKWNLATSVDLRERSDTRKPNSSPESQSKPMYYVAFGCEARLKLPVLDPDHDKVRCRWAKGHECQSVCKALPNAHLDEETCTLEFNVTSANRFIPDGIYAVALTIEDFPKTTLTMGSGSSVKRTPHDPMSSIPLQFLVQTVNHDGPCDAGPRFVFPTPKESQVITVEVKDDLKVELFADNSGDTSAKADDITASGPLGMTLSPVTPATNLNDTFTATLTWKTTQKDVGNHIVCTHVTNEKGRIGAQRCFTVEVVSRGCQASPCQNDGKCVANNYVCVCRPGFTGHDCEVNIDDCVSHTCPEDTHYCLDGIGTYSCVKNKNSTTPEPTDSTGPPKNCTCH